MCKEIIKKFKSVIIVNGNKLDPLEEIQNHTKLIEDIIGKTHGIWKYYVWHSLAVMLSQEVHKEDVIHWHMNSIENGGFGWSRPGYAKILLPNGVWEVIRPHDYDRNIEGGEMTWGAKGFNKNCIHIGIVGGLDENGKPADTVTPLQYEALQKDAVFLTIKAPWIKIIGHYQLDPVNKPHCPGFDVPFRLRQMRIPKENIREGIVT